MIDRILAGRYKIVSSIGEGGMSRVWRAQDMNTGKYVAVKVLRDEFQEDETFVRRFEREAQAASRMTHPNIANLLDVGLEEDGTRYLVIEYVQGKTLKQFIQESGAIRPETAAQIIIRVLAAVQHAHQNGVIHRDIKPQNILIDKEGTVKVSDFGIARLANTQTMSHDTETVMGSVYYFSPEQAKGADVDEKSDIYSVGAVLYEMLTGRVPFTGDTPVAIAMKHLQEAPVPPSEINQAVSPALDFVVLHAMEKRPRHRYASAADMLRDVRLAMDHPDTILAARAELERREREARAEQRREKHNEKRTRWIRRVLVGVFSVILLAVTALAGYWIMESILRSRANVVEVPNFFGMHWQEGVNLANELDLKPSTSAETYDLAPEGVVFDQSVAPGTIVEPGTTVTLFYYRSNFEFSMPNVKNIPLDQAQQILSTFDVTVNEITREINQAEVGLVIDQSIAPGTPTNKGSTIDLVVSEGSVTMPRLLDMATDSATDMISTFKLRTERIIEEPVDDVTKIGRVIAQVPPPYKEIAINTPVTLTIGVEASTTYHGEIVVDLSNITEPGFMKVFASEAGSEDEKDRRTVSFEELPEEYTVPVYSETPGDGFYTVYYNNEVIATGVVSYTR